MTSAQSERIRSHDMRNDGRGLRKFLWSLAAGLVVGLAWFTPLLGHWLRALEPKADDFLSRVAPPEPREEFLFLGIDEPSLALTAVPPEEVSANESLSLMKGRFPWDRKVYALAIEELFKNGARLVILDLLFSEPSDSPESDDALAEIIGKYRDRVILAGAFSPGEGMHAEETLSFVEPLPDFLGPIEGGTRFGYINFWTHPGDKTIRTIDYRQTPNEVNGLERHPDETPLESLAGAAALALERELPEGRVNAAFSNAKAYQPESFYRLFTGELPDVKGQIVMIGPAAERFQDTHATPAGILSGPQIHLHALGAILGDDFLIRLDSSFWRIAALLLGSVAAFLIVLADLRPLRLLLGGLGLLLLLGLAAIIAAYCGILFPIIPALAAAAAVLVTALAMSAVADRIQRDQIRRHLQRSLSPAVADAVISSPEGYLDASRGGKKAVAVLFSDVRDFTSMAETMEASDLVIQLNEYFSEMTKAVFDHGGVIDKFIGDAVMATWGGLAVSEGGDPARQAVLAGEEMLERLEKLNEKWSIEGRPTFTIGIGIHLGEAVVGEVGSESRSDFTVLGDAVNLASRIEGFTKQAGFPLIISESVNESLGGFSTLLGRFRLKGKSQDIALYLPGANALPAGFEQALELIDDSPEVMAAIDHPLARLYRDHFRDGVVTVSSK